MRAIFAVVVLTACGPGGRTGDTGVDAGSSVDAPATVNMSRVYAHSGTTLYRLDPANLLAAPVGVMTGLDPMRSLLDLAVDRNGMAVGVSREKIYRVDTTTGGLELLADLSVAAQGFNSLSYAPTDPTVETSPEILVSANDAGDVYKIDLSGVQAVPILMGNFGTATGGQIRSSGDLVGVHGYGIFSTVNIGDDRESFDYLARVDPSNGWRATPLPQSTGFNKIFGLGFWGGQFYGFVDNGVDMGGTSLGGRMITIDPVTGVGTEIGPSDIRWFGAAVTTVAPIL